MKLKDATTIISGGGSGLGFATAKEFASEGANVVIFDLNDSGSGTSADAFGAKFWQVDVTDEGQVNEAVEGVADSLGGIAVCVNCAGIGTAGAVFSRRRQNVYSQFKRTIDINLCGTFNVIRAVAPFMARNSPSEDGERGAIINTASIAAFEGQPGQAAYSASKAGIAGMSVPLAREFASKGIRVNSIAPGIFDTPMLHGLPSPELKERLAADVVFPRRLGKPREFARLARFLAECAYMNGETVRIDAGLRLPKSVSS